MNRLHVLCTLGAMLAADAASAAPNDPAKTDGPAFDREAAATVLSSIDLQKCRATNTAKGEGHVVITFQPAGAASDATVDRGPWVGTPVAKCIATQFKKAKVPAFRGNAVNVGKTIRFE